MVPLSTSADESEGIAPVPLPNRQQPSGDVRERLIPRDPSETTIRLSLERVLQTIVVVLVVIETGGFLADVSFRNGMFLVATDPSESTGIDVDPQSTIA
jgi:hypothetical protein